MSKEELDNKLNELGVWERILKLEDCCDIKDNQYKELKEEVDNVKDDIKNLQSLKENNETLQRNVKTQAERICQLEDEKSKLEESLNQVIKKLEGDKASQAETIEKMEDDIETKAEIIEKLEVDNKTKAETIEKLERENQVQKEKNDSMEKAWETAVSMYKNMLLLMYKCESLQEYVKAFGMDVNKKGNDMQSVVSFVSLFGNQTTFAPLLYQFYENNGKVLDDDDYAFIDEVNCYYKKTYGFEYDILVLPENSSGRFDKEFMKDKENPNSPFMRYSEVYTPAVMRDQKNVEKRMVVKGEKS